MLIYSAQVFWENFKLICILMINISFNFSDFIINFLSEKTNIEIKFNEAIIIIFNIIYIYLKHNILKFNFTIHNI